MLRSNYLAQAAQTTIIVSSCLIPIKAQAALFVSSSGTSVVLNIKNTGEIETIFTPGNSSILKYDEQTGQFLGEFIPKGVIKGVATGIAFGPDNNLYVADLANDSVKRFDGITGEFIDDFISAGSGGLYHPEEVVFGPDRNLYVSGLTGAGVLKYDGKTGEFIEGITTNPFNNDLPLAASIINFNKSNQLYISSIALDNSILRYDLETRELEQIVTPEDAQLIPSGIAFDSEGNIYNGTFASPDQGLPPTTVLRYDSEGNPLGVFVDGGSGGLNQASRLRFGPDENLYVVSPGSNEVLRYDGSTGDFIDAFVTAGSGGINFPTGMVFKEDYSVASVPEASSVLGVLFIGSLSIFSGEKLIKNNAKYSSKT